LRSLNDSVRRLSFDFRRPPSTILVLQLFRSYFFTHSSLNLLGMFVLVLYRSSSIMVQYWSLLNWHNLRFRCGCVAVPVHLFFVFIATFFRCLRTLYIVWSLVRRRVTRCLTELQTMCNVLKYRKILNNVTLRLRCGCGYFFNLLKTSTVPC